MARAKPLSARLSRVAALLLFGLLLVGVLLGGCGRRSAEEFEGAWQGVLPCVDCAELEVELSLRRASGEPARYTLVERYRGGAFEGEFASEGEWREVDCALDGEQGACFVLVDAAQRWFQHDDGSLEAVSADGQPIDPEGARLTRL